MSQRLGPTIEKIAVTDEDYEAAMTQIIKRDFYPSLLQIAEPCLPNGRHSRGGDSGSCGERNIPTTDAPLDGEPNHDSRSCPARSSRSSVNVTGDDDSSVGEATLLLNAASRANLSLDEFQAVFANNDDEGFNEIIREEIRERQHALDWIHTRAQRHNDRRDRLITALGNPREAGSEFELIGHRASEKSSLLFPPTQDLPRLEAQRQIYAALVDDDGVCRLPANHPGDADISANDEPSSAGPQPGPRAIKGSMKDSKQISTQFSIEDARAASPKGRDGPSVQEGQLEAANKPLSLGLGNSASLPADNPVLARYLGVKKRRPTVHASKTRFTDGELHDIKHFKLENSARHRNQEEAMRREVIANRDIHSGRFTKELDPNILATPHTYEIPCELKNEVIANRLRSESIAQERVALRRSTQLKEDLKTFTASSAGRATPKHGGQSTSVRSSLLRTPLARGILRSAKKN